MNIATTIIEDEARPMEQREALAGAPESKRPTADLPPLFSEVRSKYVPGLSAKVVGWGQYAEHGGVHFVTLLVGGAHYIHCSAAEIERSWSEV